MERTVLADRLWKENNKIGVLVGDKGILLDGTFVSPRQRAQHPTLASKIRTAEVAFVIYLS